MHCISRSYSHDIRIDFTCSLPSIITRRTSTGRRDVATVKIMIKRPRNQDKNRFLAGIPDVGSVRADRALELVPVDADMVKQVVAAGLPSCLPRSTHFICDHS